MSGTKQLYIVILHLLQLHEKEVLKKKEKKLMGMEEQTNKSQSELYLQHAERGTSFWWRNPLNVQVAGLEDEDKEFHIYSDWVSG